MCHAVWNAHVAIDDSAVGMWCHILFYVSMDFFITMSWHLYLSSVVKMTFQMNVYDPTALFCHSMLEKNWIILCKDFDFKKC